jgi:hypothetical protein
MSSLLATPCATNSSIDRSPQPRIQLPDIPPSVLWFMVGGRQGLVDVGRSPDLRSAGCGTLDSDSCDLVESRRRFDR